MCVVASLVAGCGGALAPLADEALPPASASAADARVRVPLEPRRVRVDVRVTALTTHSLQIPVVAGTWSAPRGRLDQSLVELELELGAMTSAPQKIADIAKSPHFLHTAQYPRARLEGRWLRPRETAKAPGYELFFDLVLKNRRKHLLAPASLARVGCDVRITMEFRIDRHDFGVAGQGRYEEYVGRGIEVRIEATAPAAPFGEPCVESAG